MPKGKGVTQISCELNTLLWYCDFYANPHLFLIDAVIS